MKTFTAKEIEDDFYKISFNGELVAIWSREKETKLLGMYHLFVVKKSEIQDGIYIIVDSYSTISSNLNQDDLLKRYALEKMRALVTKLY